MMAKQYYECHITIEGDFNFIKPHVEAIGWTFSAIDGDPTLGDGVKCYATRQFNARNSKERVEENLHHAALSLRRAGCNVVREKIELVVLKARYVVESIICYDSDCSMATTERCALPIEHTLLEKTLAKLVKERDDSLKAVGGCGDGGCCVHVVRGQHTNGGCRCVRYPEDRFRAERALRINQKFASAVEALLGGKGKP